MKRIIVDQKLHAANRSFIAAMILLLISATLVGIGGGVIEGVEGKTPLVLGISCLALAFVFFGISLRLKFR